MRRPRPTYSPPGIREKLLGLVNLCAPYSAIGSIFMFWVGTMISHQPFLIVGLEDIDHCKKNAYGAMWLFIVNFATCVTYLIYIKHSRPRREHIDPHEGRPILPPGMTDYIVNTELELSSVNRYRDEISMDVIPQTKIVPYRDEISLDENILQTTSDDDVIDMHDERQGLI